MYEHRDSVKSPMRYTARAISSTLETDAGEEQLTTDAVQAILFDMDGVLCNSEEMTQRRVLILYKVSSC